MKTNNELKIIADRARLNALLGITTAASGHPGGSLSICDLLTYLYFNEMRIDPQNPKMENRDRFVLSKGHCAPALYGVLSERGFFPCGDVCTLRSTASYLQGHPDVKTIPGVDMSTGSLGQGISAANGMALAAKLDKRDYRVYSILGDGELEEGQVWEAAMFAAHYKLDNLTAFVDFNGLQIDGRIEDVMSPLPIDEKFHAFGWNVILADAHDFDSLAAAIAQAKECKGKPTVVIMKSIKGKGVSFMENEPGWHGAAPSWDQFNQAKAEIQARIESLGGTIS